MKRNYIILSLITITGSILISNCSKLELSPLSEGASLKSLTSKESSGITRRTRQEISVANEMLVFNSMEDFRATFDRLMVLSGGQAGIRDLKEASPAPEYPVSEKPFDAKEQKVYNGPSELSVLRSFESKYGFTSLRKSLEDPKTQRDGLEPLAHYVASPTLRAILSSRGEVQIGKSIYIVTDGIVYEITDANVKTLTAIRKGSVEPGAANMIIHDYTTKNPMNAYSDCTSWKRTTSVPHVYSNGKKRWFQDVAIRNYPWGTVFNATTLNQKKNWLGAWVGSKYSYLAAQVWGYMWDTQCVAYGQFGGNFKSESNSSRVTSQFVFWGYLRRANTVDLSKPLIGYAQFGGYGRNIFLQ